MVESFMLAFEVAAKLWNGNSQKCPHPGLHLFLRKLLALKWETLSTSAFLGLLVPELILCMGLLLDPSGFLKGHPIGTVRAGELRSLHDTKQ